MQFEQTDIADLVIIKPDIKGDDRGALWRTFSSGDLLKQGVSFEVVQASATFTKDKGTLRGMHFQTEPHAEDKIVQCLEGSVYDVAVDLRKDSPSFGKWFGVELNDKNRYALLIPKGFAHGLQTLRDNCVVHYFMSEVFMSDSARGIAYNDPETAIAWPLEARNVSEKDQNLPKLSDL